MITVDFTILEILQIILYVVIIAIIILVTLLMEQLIGFLRIVKSTAMLLIRFPIPLPQTTKVKREKSFTVLQIFDKM